MAAAARTDPPPKPLAAVLEVLGELEVICEKDANSLAMDLVKINSKVQLMDGHAKDLQKEMPTERAAIKSRMQSLNDTVTGFIAFENTARKMRRNDADLYMTERPRAATLLRTSVAQAALYFSSITY